MSQLTIENIIRRISASHSTAYRLLNIHPGIPTIAVPAYLSFTHHNPLPFFLQKTSLLSISIKQLSERATCMIFATEGR